MTVGTAGAATVHAPSGMVATADHLASSAGVATLRAGGNAVDAVVAVQWALAVCYPQAGNLGGGGFLMYRSAEGEVSALDFREKAPSAAYEKLFQDREGNVVEGISLNTRLGAGVPGSVEGIFSMHREFGSMDMPALMQPAITLAREGFELTAVQAELLNRYRDDFVARNRAEVAFVKKAGKWEAGDTLVQPELASTLERIRTYGEDEFYAGTTAQLIEEEMLFGRGLISGQDLAEYTAVWRTPVETEFYGYRLYGVPPPSSGGVTIGQMLALAEMLRVDTLDLSHTNRLADYVHRMIEIQRRTFADRAAYLGDPEFRPAPVVDLLDSAYLASRIADLDLHRASPPLAPNPYSIRESRETTHISIVDAEGNAASVTTTLNGLYGSKIAVTGAGFLLNKWTISAPNRAVPTNSVSLGARPMPSPRTNACSVPCLLPSSFATMICIS